MGTIETIVTDEWLRIYGGSYDRIGFNVPVYVNSEKEPMHISASKRRSAGNEGYRIDILGGFGDEVEIIEVKETGNMTAIGQLLSYRYLFLRTYTGFRIIHLRLVCVRAREAIVACCANFEINLDQMHDRVEHLIQAHRHRRRLRCDAGDEVGLNAR